MTRGTRGTTKTVRSVVDELRRQGWTVTPTSNGHWRAKPVDNNKELVHISMLGGSNSLNNAMRDLKRNGFVWPPPPKCREAMAKKPMAHAHALEVVRAPQDPTVPTAQKDLDDVFLELKDAKTYLVLTGEILSECRVALDKAQAAFDSATAEREAAVDALRVKKAAFDVAFGDKE